VAQERAHSTGEINKAVRKHISPGKPVKIGGLDGHEGVLAGLRGEGKVRIAGKAGAFLAAFLAGPEVTLSGSAGDFAGSTMVSGSLVVEGTVGRGMCCHMIGGTARVKGRVGANAGAMMTGGLLVLDAPIGPGPGEGMTGGTLVLLRPNHLPRHPPSAPAKLIVPRGTSKGVSGYKELEMDHQEVEELAGALKDLDVNSPDKVADLMVILVADDGTPLQAAAPPPREGRTRETEVVLEVAKPKPPRKKRQSTGSGAKEKAADPSERFADFSKEIGEGS
jgi:hypothetical protein